MGDRAGRGGGMTAVFPRPPGRDAATRDLEAFIPLARLATLSETLAAQPLGPSAAFRSELRTRLLAEHAARSAGNATDEPADPAPVSELAPTHRHRALRASAAGVALVLAGGGVAAAAAGDSLPGDTLHPLKRFTESVRAAIDPHRDQPSHVLREIDVRLSELRRSSRPALGATPRGVALERWPAMLSALSEVKAELDRLAPRAADPTVRAALLERRQRLADIIPTLTAAQQPAVQRLIAQIDAMTGSPAAGGLLPLPGVGAAAPPVAVARAIDDVLAALRTDATAVAGVPAPQAPDGRTGTPTSSSAASPDPDADAAGATNSTGALAVSSARSGSSSAPLSGSASSPRSTAAGRTVVRQAARTAPMVRTVTVTVTTVTTRTADGVATTRVGPTTRTVTTTAGVVGQAVGRTVSTTTRTVVTDAIGSTLPGSPLTSARPPGVPTTS